MRDIHTVPSGTSLVRVLDTVQYHNIIHTVYKKIRSSVFDFEFVLLFCCLFIDTFIRKASTQHTLERQTIKTTIISESSSMFLLLYSCRLPHRRLLFVCLFLS
jgi:hypothetical protein